MEQRQWDVRQGREMLVEGGRGRGTVVEGREPKVEGVCVCVCARFGWKTHENINVCHVQVPDKQAHELSSQTGSPWFLHCALVHPGLAISRQISR